MSTFFRFILPFTLALTVSAQSGGDVVSVEELRNPLAGKSLRAILTAQEHLKSGQRDRGVQELREALSDPVALPYAISMLGVEHLRSGQTDVAIRELDQAARLLPGRPENHANLAYAFYLERQTRPGLEEARRALKLDGGRPQTRLVLGLLLLQQGSHDAEAVQHLQLAAQESPDAHLALARHYENIGCAPEAEKERRAYTITSMGLLAPK